MATNGVEKLDQIRKELTCAICHGCLQTPTLLSCNHSYCRQCLVKLHNSSANKLQLECPICRQTTALPEGKVEALKTNFQLQSLIDIAAEETCQSARSLNAHSQPSQKEALCEKHGKPLEHFCTDCYELLCSKCITAHRGHRFYHIDEPDLQTEVEALHNEVQEVVAKAENTRKQLHANRDDVLSNGGQTREAIRAHFRKAQETLQDREKNLLSAVQQYTDASLATLIKHSEQLEKRISFLPDVGERRHDIGLLTSWKGIKKQLEACEQSVSSTAKECEPGATFLRFKGDNSILPALNELGVLNECQREQTGTMYVTTRRIEVGDGGHNVYVPLTHPTSAGVPTVIYSTEGGVYAPSSFLPQPQRWLQYPPPPSPPPQRLLRYPPPPSPPPQRLLRYPPPPSPSPPQRLQPPPSLLEEDLYHDMTSHKRSATFTIGQASEAYDVVPDQFYEVPVQTVKPDRTVPRAKSLTFAESVQHNTRLHKSESDADGIYESLPGSPPSHPGQYEYVPTLPPPNRKRRPSVKPASLIRSDVPQSCKKSFPNGVCCDPVHDTIVITDVHNHCVRLLDSSGNFIAEIGNEGKDRGEFKEPVAVVFSGDHFYVAEEGNSRIQKFTHAGQFCTMFGRHRVKAPAGLAVDHSGNLYVSDSEKSQILIYQKDKYLRSIGSTSKDGFVRFKTPAGIAIDKQGMLLVADRGIHCVWKMTMEGKVLQKMGSGHLGFPYGVAVTHDGFVVVSEIENSRISIFSPDGELIHCFSEVESVVLRLPRHVCVNSKGQIIVADSGNDQLQVFDFSCK